MVDAPPPQERVPSATPEPVEDTSTRKSGRARRPTWKILQRLPEVTPATPDVPKDTDSDSDGTPPPTVSAYVWEAVTTIQNSFGLYREYPSLPTHDPEKNTNSVSLSNIPPPSGGADAVDTRLAPTTDTMTASRSASVPEAGSSLGPFKNSTIFGLMNWMWTGSPLKSIQQMAQLIGFLKSDEFKKEDLEGFDIAAETTKFDEYLEGTSKKPLGLDVKVPVDIQVPDGKEHTSYDDVPVFSVPGLHFRNLTEVIKTVLSDQGSRFFHYTPFKLLWKRTASDAPQRVYDEIYSSNAMITAHTKLQKQPPEPGCTLERVIAALMFWSDSTHLANFGTASLWPLYLYFGNQSKWVRGKVRAGACHHVAYMPKVCFHHRASSSLNSR
ncbi:hypothetical protein B0H16DRAFT_1338519 [Mycena metata]|uniref:Uncharacterized protein n=1 Tax=Mycena metata TaxID=1033252 RepID=A0AAD7HCF0_9AGAR|nr:hypothetical protein B0H16DRAFT_1338519 [Mycena metata]